MARISPQDGRVLSNPPWVSALFSNTEYSWVWLIARIYIGWGWLEAGREKLASDAWMGGGVALQKYWERAVIVPDTGRPTIAYDWYREFLQFLLNFGAYTWFAKLVAVGELLVGIALLVGILTGIAALFGALMNWSFMLAGSASTNPVMGLLALGVLVAWKTAGWWGLDRLVLPALGAPWQPGSLLGGEKLQGSGRRDRRRIHQAEQWVRMLIGVGVALFALARLTGALEVVILLLAGVLVAVTGLGLLSVVPSLRSRARS